MQRFTYLNFELMVLNVKVATMFEPHRSLSDQLAIENEVFGVLSSLVIPSSCKERIIQTLRNAFFTAHTPFYETVTEVEVAFSNYCENQIEISQEMSALCWHYQSELTRCHGDYDVDASGRLVNNARAFLDENKDRLSVKRFWYLKAAIETASG